MNKSRILLIDDEAQVRKLLEITLDSEGYQVLQAETGKEGIRMAAMHQPDLILLDLGLPDVSGQDVLREIRSFLDRPVLILSVQNEEAQIVQALDNGAVDFLGKPFRTAELLARIRSVLRRAGFGTTSTIGPLVFGDLEIDPSLRQVRLNGVEVHLTQTEFNLLLLMARNADRVLTHPFLLKEIRGVGFQEDTQYLRVFVNTLRKKIEADPTKPVHIQTLTGIGYRFG
jgi:two-component system KDP operon response regulator KdpE